MVLRFPPRNLNELLPGVFLAFAGRAINMLFYRGVFGSYEKVGSTGDRFNRKGVPI